LYIRPTSPSLLKRKGEQGQPGQHPAIFESLGGKTQLSCRISGGNAKIILRYMQRRGENQTKTDVVVEVVGFVPVPIRTARVVSIVVPRTAAHHAQIMDAPFTTELTLRE
jgi:hypothetical protein